MISTYIRIFCCLGQSDDSRVHKEVADFHVSVFMYRLLSARSLFSTHIISHIPLHPHGMSSPFIFVCCIKMNAFHRKKKPTNCRPT